MSLLSMACFPPTWWPLALQCWIMMWNGFRIGPDGLTPYYRRFGRHPDYKQYPFGALVFVHPREKGVKAPKMEHRMLPYVFVGVGVGPAYDWSRTYAVVPLKRLLGEHRPSRSTVRYSNEVFFPERLMYPCKQRLHLAGAVRDATFPAPAIADEGQKWEIEGSDRGASDDEGFDGEEGENAPRFLMDALAESLEFSQEDLEISTDPLEIDAPPAETSHEPAVPSALDPEVDRTIEGVVPEAERAKATGWRIDTFGDRRISVPPWSRRPPDVWPEVWVMWKEGAGTRQGQVEVYKARGV